MSKILRILRSYHVCLKIVRKHNKVRELYFVPYHPTQINLHLHNITDLRICLYLMGKASFIFYVCTTKHLCVTCISLCLHPHVICLGRETANNNKRALTSFAEACLTCQTSMMEIFLHYYFSIKHHHRSFTEF